MLIVVEQRRTRLHAPVSRDEMASSPLEEARASLAPLLALARAIASASAAALLLEGPEGRQTLSKGAASDEDQAHLDHLLERSSAKHGPRQQVAGLWLVRAPTRPALLLAVLAERAPDQAMLALLDQVLQLAAPLIKAAEQARLARQARRMLLDLEAEMAQEVRTPLTAVSGFAQLLRRSKAIDQRRRVSYAAIAAAETQQATEAIDLIVNRLQHEAEELGVATGEVGSPDDNEI